MTDLIDIVPGQEMDGSAAAYEGDIVHGSISALVAAVPALLEPGAAGELARHVNNFAQGVDFEPIMDPAAFARATKLHHPVSRSPEALRGRRSSSSEEVALALPGPP